MAALFCGSMKVTSETSGGHLKAPDTKVNQGHGLVAVPHSDMARAHTGRGGYEHHVPEHGLGLHLPLLHYPGFSVLIAGTVPIVDATVAIPTLVLFELLTSFTYRV